MFVPAWATVLLTLGPAAITGLVAWFGARYQRDTSLAETDEATLRIRIEHAENDRQRRQRAYHEFLVGLERLDSMMQGFAPLDEARFQDWLSGYHALLQGVRLFGESGVRNALGPAVLAVDSVASEAARGDARQPFQERLQFVYVMRRDEIIETHVPLIEAMRQDVAPDALLSALSPALEQEHQSRRD